MFYSILIWHKFWKLSLPASKLGQIGTVAIFDHGQVWGVCAEVGAGRICHSKGICVQQHISV